MGQLARKAALGCLFLVSPCAVSYMAAPPADFRLEQGQEIAFDRSKGNCLACHAIADGQLPGNIGPPLVAMKLRFPDRALLRAQIWDATNRNPDSIMPPFGKHRILTDEEIDLVVEYLYSL